MILPLSYIFKTSIQHRTSKSGGCHFSVAMKHSFILISKYFLLKLLKNCAFSDKMKLIILFAASILQAVM